MKTYGKLISGDELKRLELDILLDVAAFCDREGLAYSLCAGTLLGAIRHQGFIPWDDDIDIMMPRADFERFLKTYRTDKPYKAVSSDTEADFPFPYAVVNDTRTIKVELKLRDCCTQTLGVNVDVFPLDPVPGDLEEAKDFYGRIHRRWRFLESVVKCFGKGKSALSTLYRNVFILFCRVLEGVGLTSVRKAVRASAKIARTYEGTKQGRIGVTSIYHYDVRESHPAAVYEGRRNVCFEGYTFKGLLHAEEYLAGMYGDFMKLPPVEKRVTHHTSDCYWR